MVHFAKATAILGLLGATPVSVLALAPAASATQVAAPGYAMPSSQHVDDPSGASVALSVPLPPPAPRIFAITPERRALLNTIRFAEGTWANGHDRGYWIMFGGGLMPSLDRHPDRVVRSARYASAAAGAYQFMPPTWAMVTRSLGFRTHGPDAFGPQVQDQAAIYLVQRRGALALADRGEFTPELAHRLAPEWASFPTLAGRSFYGQPVKRYEELRRFYEANLYQLRAQVRARQEAALLAAAARAETARAEQEPACLPADSLRCRLEALEGVGSRSRPGQLGSS
ncbi:MAG: endolysin [Cyanobium sp. Prado107]|nr:endolysin [Cyanobium sp. Prado107]